MAHPLQPSARAEEKRASREADARAVASGKMTREQLARKNTFIPAKNLRVDFERATPLK
jgi:hypothetical protein